MTGAKWTPSDEGDTTIRVTEDDYPSFTESEMLKLALKNPVVMKGTLASEVSKVDLVRDSEGNYKIEVTFMDENVDGTLEVILIEGVFVQRNTGIYMGASNKVNRSANAGYLQFEHGRIVSDVWMNGPGTTLPGLVFAMSMGPGEQSEKSVSFDIDLCEGTELRGDVNSDGKVDASDVELLNNYITQGTGEINLIASDINGDGVVNVFDSAKLRKLIIDNGDDDKTSDSIYLDSICLDGDLAESSTYELIKDSNGDYSIKVTIPDDITEGTIGVTLADGVFINTNGEMSTKESSELFNYSNTENPKSDETGELKVIDQKNEKQDDGKIKVTLTVNKELDKDKIPDGWTLSEDGKSISKVMNKDEKEELELVAKDGSKLTYTVVASADSSGSDTDGKDEDKTTADSKIPYAGAYNTITVAIICTVIVAIITFSKLRKIKK